MFSQADWTLILGEGALDIVIPSFSPSAHSIFVLGERNLYCLKDNGQIRFMKKLEYNSSCFLPYAAGTVSSLGQTRPSRTPPSPHTPFFLSDVHHEHILVHRRNSLRT